MNLTDHIKSQIASQGPLNIAEYMTLCLLHPTAGYYTTATPFGRAGDFVTAPEISQVFGELVGLALAQAWLDQGSPAPFTLAELGPGKGTLMADLLRATRRVPGFAEAAQITLVEASDALKEVQRKALAGFDVGWIPDAAHLPDAPLFLIANEFFDALPIRQFIRDGDLWRERQIGLADDQLVFGLAPAQSYPALAHRLDDTKDGDLVETCAPAQSVVDQVANRIASFGGAALLIDYGDWRSLGDTLQAVQNHSPREILSNPGQADLSAHVDFEALAHAAPACTHSKLTPQGVFLERLGITTRAQMLAQNQTSTLQQEIITATRRLTHPDEMGTLFKVLGLVPKEAEMLPGLSA